MIRETKGKDGNLVWKINKAKNTYEYFFKPDGSQGKLVSKLTFRNITKKPAGLNSNGYGFTRPLQPLYRLLKDYFTKIDEIVVAQQKSVIKGRVIYFNKDEYELMSNSLIATYRANANKLQDSTLREMSNIFPRRFKLKDKSPSYNAGTLSRLLSRKGIANQLSDDDIAKIVDIIPGLMDKSAKAKAGVLSKIQFSSIQNKTSSYQLKKIIDRYELLLKRKSQKENEWQEFLKQNITFINSAYIKMVDRKNISTKTSIPDFLLIDQFQFVDVFEIKRPDLHCLSYDKSHDNHYWSTDANKAIAQVEKYLFQLERNARSIIEDLKEQKIEVNLIRPRGYVLIGKRSDLSEKGQNSFRILNESLKNIKVIFFDDLLIALKSKYTVIKKK